jgi:hypothetical protein
MEILQAVGRMKTEQLAHPSYSAGLSSGNFWFFGRAKTALQNRRFADADVMVRGLSDLFDSVIFEELQRVFQNWIKRLEWLLRHNGQYFIK